MKIFHNLLDRFQNTREFGVKNRSHVIDRWSEPNKKFAVTDNTYNASEMLTNKTKFLQFFYLNVTDVFVFRSMIKFLKLIFFQNQTEILVCLKICWYTHFIFLKYFGRLYFVVYLTEIAFF